MADDRAYGSPTSDEGGSGFSRKIGPLPMWVWVVGVGGVVLFIYYRKKQAGTTGGGLAGLFGGAAATSPGTVSPTSTDGSGAVNWDPNTGLPIDPTTGLPYLNAVSSQGSQATLQGWVTSAEAAAKSMGLNPAAVEKALYDFTNGNALDTREEATLEKILGKVGQPPDLLPFFGTIPNPPRTVKKPPPVKAKPVTHPKLPADFGNPIFWKWLQGVTGNKAAAVTPPAPKVFAPKLPVKEPLTRLQPGGYTPHRVTAPILKGNSAGRMPTPVKR
jgi:hypothetical protein